MGRLEGKVAIVTGAGSGIGRASAIRFAMEGADVACVDFDREGAETTVASIGERGLTVVADVSKEADAERMVAETVERFGAPTVLYANAGVSGRGTAAEVTMEDWQRVIGINLTGVWLSCKHALPPMIEAGGGSIINQASVTAQVGFPSCAPYSAAKGGVMALTRQMAADYGPHNIRVNAICPGTVPTPMVRNTYARVNGLDLSEVDAVLEKEWPDQITMGRLGTPDDIASLALYLASDESSWITGTTPTIDGGMTAV